MKHRIARLVLLSIIALSACATPAPIDYSDLAITMNYTLGWGQGGYELTVDASGNVSYQGCQKPIFADNDCSLEQGSGKISVRQVERLVQAINKADVWALDDVIHKGFLICADCTMIDLSITLNGRGKSIRYPDDACSPGDAWWGAVPTALCSVQQQMEAIRDMVVRSMPATIATANP